MTLTKQAIHNPVTISAPTFKELFVLVRGMPWRSLKIYSERGVPSAACQNWIKTPNRARA